MFERFTERARNVVVLAQDEARALSHHHVGTEHILLGLLGEREGLAARTLDSLDITVQRVRPQVLRIVGSGDGEATAGQIPFTPRAKKILELALHEALNLDHNYIGTEHILLGLVRENDGVGARVLLDFDAGPDRVRNEITRLLGTARAPTGARRAPGVDDWVHVGASAGVRRLLRGAAARALDDDRSEIEVSDVLLELSLKLDDATVRDAIKRRGNPGGERSDAAAGT